MQLHVSLANSYFFANIHCGDLPGTVIALQVFRDSRLISDVHCFVISVKNQKQNNRAPAVMVIYTVVVTGLSLLLLGWETVSGMYYVLATQHLISSLSPTVQVDVELNYCIAAFAIIFMIDFIILNV